jgi:monovalent cation:H+ antiporter, CPA1 family
VVLAIIGTLIGLAAISWSITGATFSTALAIEIFEFSIRANVFLYVLLPTLLFQVSLGLNLRRMADDWVPILVMAVLAVVVATFVIGFALTPFTTAAADGLPDAGRDRRHHRSFGGGLDLPQHRRPQRLTRIVEGESLLNDAAAIALFGFFLTFVMLGVPNPTLRDALVGFRC